MLYLACTVINGCPISLLPHFLLLKIYCLQGLTVSWELVQAPVLLVGMGKGLADAPTCLILATKSLIGVGFCLKNKQNQQKATKKKKPNTKKPKLNQQPSFLTVRPGRMLKDSLNWFNQNQVSCDSRESCF